MGLAPSAAWRPAPPSTPTPLRPRTPPPHQPGPPPPRALQKEPGGVGEEGRRGREGRGLAWGKGPPITMGDGGDLQTPVGARPTSGDSQVFPREIQPDLQNSLNIKFLAGIFLGYPGPRRRDIPAKTLCKWPFSVVWDREWSGCPGIWVGTSGFAKLYGRKLWADFSRPSVVDTGDRDCELLSSNGLKPIYYL